MARPLTSPGLFSTPEGCLHATAATERTRNLARAVNGHDRELNALREAVERVERRLDELAATLPQTGLCGPRTRDHHKPL